MNDAQNNFLERNLVIREPLLVSVLVVLAVVFFTLTHWYSQAYDRRRVDLGSKWFAHGLQELQANQAADAVVAFRTALTYTPQNRECRLRMAEALMRSGQTAQAGEYFRSLWQQQPQSGIINLQLARMAAQKGDVYAAERYYNGAIFGDWPENPDENRRDAILELVNFYLQRHNNRQAESELLTLSSNLPDTPQLQIRVADLFMRVQNYDRALDFYKRAARQDATNVAALLGAGKAALESSDYHMAETYFMRVAHEDGSNAEAVRNLDVVQAILRLDPSERGISSEEKAGRVLQSYRIAGTRLNACDQRLKASAAAGPANATIASYLEKWNGWKRDATIPFLVRNPDRAEDLFDLSLQAEQAMQPSCGTPSVEDQALLTLIRKRSLEDK